MRPQPSRICPDREAKKTSRSAGDQKLLVEINHQVYLSYATHLLDVKVQNLGHESGQLVDHREETKDSQSMANDDGPDGG